MPSSIGRHL